jgi:hypothetical protein
MWSINDNNIPQLQNIALNGEGYIYTYAKLKYVLEKNKNIENVYLGFGYHNISSYYDNYIFGKSSLSFFDRYIDILNFNDYLILLKNNPANIIKMGPVIIQKGIKSLYDNECSFIGSFPEEKMLETYKFEQCKKRIEEQYYMNEEILPYSKINLDFFIKIIALCNEKKLKLTILNTPLQKQYSALIPQNYIKKYDQIINQYKLQVYNFKDMELPDSCFLPDGDHVNYYGALLVSKRFKEYHEQIMQNSSH